jgi:heat shock 70kDa protein 4
VSFGFKQRSIGESAKTLETSNFRNTIGSLKRLIGRTVADPEVEQVEKKFTHATLVDAGGSVGAQVCFRDILAQMFPSLKMTSKVTYAGEKRTFSATQLTGAYLGKLRDTAANELKSVVSDVVIAIPGWYTDSQRRALLDAAQIANLNVLRLVNDTTAVALGYGITKSDLPEAENPRHVVFVDVGHSALSVAVVAFSKGQLTVKATAYDRHIGGRDIDYALVRHFAEEFKTKYKIDVLANPKATFRLAAGCDKVKKVLSANAEAPLNVESIMNDIDASSRLTREAYEELLAPLLDRIPAPIQQALEDSGLTVDEIDAIELVGGGTRIPAVRAKIQSVFSGKALSTTLNQDEAAARGATFICAMLSPTFRVRDFAIHDITPYAIKVKWDKQPEDPEEDTELVVFSKGNAIPSTKILTFYRKGPFELTAEYAEPSVLPGGINPWIARFNAKDVPQDPSGDSAIVKVRTRLNQHGIVSFESAYTEEIEEREEAMAVDGEEPPKKKKVVKKNPIPFVWSSTSLDTSLLEEYRQAEAEMHAADKLVMDTEVSSPCLDASVTQFNICYSIGPQKCS